MKVLAWIGKESNQIALVNKLNEQFEVVGVVYEKRNPKSVKSYSLKRLNEKVFSRIFFGFIPRTWRKIQNYYASNFNTIDAIPSLEVNSINDNMVHKFSAKLNPDLIIVSGTSLVKKENFLGASKHGIINLHTGLSPYINGGPNCTNWCLSTGDTHLIGNTVMWIDEGIDTGNIILTEQTPLNGKERFFEIHLKVMEHAHDIYIQAIKNIENNTAKNRIQSSIGDGTVFYNKNWGLRAQFKLFINLLRFKRIYRKNKLKKVITVS